MPGRSLRLVSKPFPLFFGLHFVETSTRPCGLKPWQVRSGATPGSTASTGCWSGCAPTCPRPGWWPVSARAWPSATSSWPCGGRALWGSSFWSAGWWKRPVVVVFFVVVVVWESWEDMVGCQREGKVLSLWFKQRRTWSVGSPVWQFLWLFGCCFSSGFLVIKCGLTVVRLESVTERCWLKHYRWTVGLKAFALIVAAFCGVIVIFLPLASNTLKFGDEVILVGLVAILQCHCRFYQNIYVQ